MDDPQGLKPFLQRYLQQGRDSMVRAVDGASEYDIRRPMTPTGTNILGLIKHLTGTESGYLGASVGRPWGVTLPWEADGSVWEGADMWATADQTREYLLDLYRSVWSHSDESLRTIPLDAPASVPWWPAERRETTFGHLWIRMTAETAQHAGHADICRELSDGQAGRDHHDQGDAATWTAYLGRIQAAADAHRADRDREPG